MTLPIGGKTAPEFGGGPLTVTGTLLWKGEGRFVGDGPILDGQERSFGTTAVLRVAGIDVLIVSIAHQMLDLKQFRAFGIYPAAKSVVALKSMQHFRAAFAPIAGRIVCDVPAPLGFCLQAGFSAYSADVFAFVSAQNELTGDSRMSSL